MKWTVAGALCLVALAANIAVDVRPRQVAGRLEHLDTTGTGNLLHLSSEVRVEEVHLAPGNIPGEVRTLGMFLTCLRGREPMGMNLAGDPEMVPLNVTGRLLGAATLLPGFFPLPRLEVDSWRISLPFALVPDGGDEPQGEGIQRVKLRLVRTPEDLDCVPPLAPGELLEMKRHLLR